MNIPLRLVAAAALMAAAFSAAHAQSALTLTCPTPAAGPATPLVFATGSSMGWQFKPVSGASWQAAYTGYKHNSWYPSGSSPALGSWLTLAPPTAEVPTTEPFDFRSPAISIDSRIDLSSITTAVERTADNYHDDVGVSNTANPAGAFAGTGTYGSFSTLQSINPVLAWQHGSNQLLLRVRNAEGMATTNADPDPLTPPTYGPFGVYTKVTLTATCNPALPPAPVPADAPWALLLAGAGVAGVAVRAMRRRRRD